MGIARDIADAVTVIDSHKCLSTLEIGPGMGVLTQFLMQRSDIDLQVVEIDMESVRYLDQHYPDLSVIEGDFLEMDLSQIFGDYTGGCAEKGAQGCVVGNFPYNISSQIFFKILDYRDTVTQVVCMLQKEVAVRIAQGPGSKDYGILSVFLQAYYDIEYLFSVDPSVFNPPPKVQSGVIRLTRNSIVRLGCDQAIFRRVVKGVFNQRRKTIRNSLRAAFSNVISVDNVEGQLWAEVPYGDLRPERLSVAQFVELTLWVEAQISGSKV